ncbi:MAG: PrsW family intramembrane metalloprotease [Clostridia bacterium]|nr:PrsW family intramembrane metalloprotease [Clostridia bacterium]
MKYASLEISLLALVPAVLLCVYIYKKDRVEKEPWWLLGLLFLVGGALYIPTLLGEGRVTGWFDTLFAAYRNHDMMGVVVFDSPWMEALHGGLCAFLGVGLVEEFAKWAVLIVLTYRSKHFNSLFDGVVYATFVALGFAAVENIRYAWITGWDTLLLRAMTSVPGHLFFGIVMGYCYTMWNKCATANDLEKPLFLSGAVTRRRYRGAWLWLAAALAIPALVHGLYMFACSYRTPVGEAGFYLLMVVLYVLCFTQVNRLSDADGAVLGAARASLRKVHPTLTDEQLGLVSAEQPEEKGGTADEC